MFHARPSITAAPRPRFLRHAASVLLAALPLLFLGCASSPSSDPADAGPGEPIRVTLRDYASGAKFELVSESYDDRLGYYSEVRNDAGRKFQADDILLALVDDVGAGGFEDHSQPGRAPSRGGELLTRAFEVDVDGDLHDWPIGKGSEVKEHRNFNRCTMDFMDLYNVTQAFQVIDNEEGKRVFQQTPNRGTRR